MGMQAAGYFRTHGQAIKGCASQARHSLPSSMLSVAAIAVTLAFPFSLGIVLKQIQSVSEQWSSQREVSVFLTQNGDAEDAQALSDRIRTKSPAAEIDIVSPARAFAEFLRLSGLTESDSTASASPLPFVLRIVLKGPGSESDYDALLTTIGADKRVDSVRTSDDWLAGLLHLQLLGERVVISLALLAVAMIFLIIINVVRAEIQQRRQEMEVLRLVGATNAFIRRPFLYFGFFAGISGVLFGTVLAFTFLWYIRDVLGETLGFFATQTVNTLPWMLEISVLAISCALLGVLASAISVQVELRKLGSET